VAPIDQTHSHIDPQLHATGNRLDRTSYEQLLETLSVRPSPAADPHRQSGSGAMHPPEFNAQLAVAAGLAAPLPGAALENLAARACFNGGWQPAQLPSCKTQCLPPMDAFPAVAAVIAPFRLPGPSLAHLAASTSLIPRGMNRRADAYGSRCHYPVIYGPSARLDRSLQSARDAGARSGRNPGTKILLPRIPRAGAASP